MRIKPKTRNILIGVVVLLVVLRILLPIVILSRLNNYLATFSPIYAIHIEGLDIGFFTLSYTGHNTVGTYKKNNTPFFTTKRVRTHISIGELLRGRILTNIVIEDGSFVLTKALFNGAKQTKEESKEAAKKAARAMFPLRIALVELRDCSFDFADFLSQETKTRWRVTDINAKVININPLPENPYTSFFSEGKFLDVAPFKAVGKAKRLDDPMGLKMDFEMKGFKLTDSNPMMMHYVPFSWTQGMLDLYSEVKLENGNLEGYVKPFIKDAAILKGQKGFVSVKHFAFEVVGAFANFMLKNADDKTVATKIAFKRPAGGTFKIETGEAVGDAIKNAYGGKPISPGIEDSVPFN